MEKTYPYIFGMLHRLELQLTRIDRLQQIRSRSLSESSREFFRFHLPQLRRSTRYLRRQIMLLQLANGRKEHGLVERQIRLVYGIFEMLKPELRNAFLQLNPEQTEAPSFQLRSRRANAH